LGRRVYQSPPAAGRTERGLTAQDWGDVARIYDLEHPACRGPELRFWHHAAQGFGGPILELAAGSGRVSIALAQKGHDVTGLELSAGMLDRARARAARLGEPARERLHWVQADMADFDLGERRFGLIFVAFNSFWLLTSEAAQRRSLATIRRHLAPDGGLILDLFQPNPDDYQSEQNIAQLLATGRGGPPMLRLKDYHYDPQTRLATSDVRYYRREGRPGEFERAGRLLATFRYTMRIAEPEEVAALLTSGGFVVEDCYGSYEREPLGPLSARAIFVARPAPAAAGQRTS
jgi:SAM-dependent methyltransferase